jgi:hypothetical protein
MRLTVVPDDSCVAVNAVSYLGMDLASCEIPSDIHALQWYETYGEVEFRRTFKDGAIEHPPNQIIDTLPDWALRAKEKWEQAKAAEEAAILAAQQNIVEQATSATETTPQTT